MATELSDRSENQSKASLQSALEEPPSRSVLAEFFSFEGKAFLFFLFYPFFLLIRLYRFFLNAFFCLKSFGSVSG